MADSINRRTVMKAATAGTVAALAPSTLVSTSAGAAPMKGRIKQSLVYWCFNMMGEKWDIERMCQVAKDLGVA